MAVAVLAVLIIADRSGRLLVKRGDDVATYHRNQARVVRVIDGDTLEIDLPDALHDRPVTRVRLWGIDCPETATPDRPGEPGADEAAALARRLADGVIVTLRLEPHRPRDTFGRVLAHVELADGTSLNEALLAAGYARAADRWPHSLLGRYSHLEATARREGAGIWSTAE